MLSLQINTICNNISQSFKMYFITLQYKNVDIKEKILALASPKTKSDGLLKKHVYV